MNKIGIIAGGGLLPLLVGKNLIKNNFDITFFVLKEFFIKNKYHNFQTEQIELNCLKYLI